KSDRIEKDVDPLQQAEERGAFQPRNRYRVLGKIHVGLRERRLHALLEFLGKISADMAEEDELAASQPAGYFDKHPIVLRGVLDGRARTKEQRRAGIDT